MCRLVDDNSCLVVPCTNNLKFIPLPLSPFSNSKWQVFFCLREIPSRISRPHDTLFIPWEMRVAMKRGRQIVKKAATSRWKDSSVEGCLSDKEATRSAFLVYRRRIWLGPLPGVVSQYAFPMGHYSLLYSVMTGTKVG